MWIFDIENKAWRLLNRGAASSGDSGPLSLYAPQVMAYSIDDDLFMMLNTGSDQGTWFFDVYSNTWPYHPIAANTTATPTFTYIGSAGLTYDEQNKKFLKFGNGYQQRHAFTYTMGDTQWRKTGGWAYTTLSGAFTSGDDHIHVTDATGAEVGGSVTIKNVPATADCADCGECYAYFTRSIDHVDGSAIYFAAGIATCNSTTFASGTDVEIYPAVWPPSTGVSDYSYPWTMWSFYTQLGYSSTFDSINNTNLIFVPLRTQPVLTGQSWNAGDMVVYAYDLATETMTRKSQMSSLGGNYSISHRAYDNYAMYMSPNRASIISETGQIYGGDGTNDSIIAYYRYGTESSAVERPQGLTASVTETYIDLSWTAVSGATGYYVYRESGGEVYGRTWTTKLNSGDPVVGTTFRDSDVSASTKYYYRVQATDGSNNSRLSAIARGIPKIVLDGYVSINAAANQETITWETRQTGMTYTVYRSLTTYNEYYSGTEVTVSPETGWTQYSGNCYVRSWKNDFTHGNQNYQIKSARGATAGTLTDVTYVASCVTTANSYVQYGDKFYVNVGGSPAENVYFTVQAFLDASYAGSHVVATAYPTGTWTSVSGCADISENSCVDSTDLNDAGSYPYKVYAYRVVAKNALGVSGGPSPYWLTIPRSPRKLNWKETVSGSDIGVSLMWDANPESGVTYNVYRLSGRAGAFTKITASPISGTTYNAGNLPTSGGTPIANVYYYVVAIDAAGQEGIPSTGAWTNRSGKSFWENYGYLTDYNSGVDGDTTIINLQGISGASGVSFR